MKNPLILIPGLTCTAALWHPQLEGLADIADMTVADHSGHDTLAEIARDILARAPARFAVAGLSMGGYIAFEIMRQAPARVTRLALLDTSAKPFDPAQKAHRQALITEAHASGMTGVMMKLLPNFIHPRFMSDSALVETVVQMGRETGPVVFERQQQALMSRADNRPLLAAIRCPTLALCGAQDLLTPVVEHEFIAAGIAGATLDVIPDCGHLATLERPDRVNIALRRWLTT